MGERELGGSKLGRGSTAALDWDGRTSGASGWNELRSSRLRRWELDGSRLEWKELIDSKLRQRKLGGSRLRSLVQTQMVKCGSRIQRTEGARYLRVEAEGAR